jgi:hypothetical protein
MESAKEARMGFVIGYWLAKDTPQEFFYHDADNDLFPVDLLQDEPDEIQHDGRDLKVLSLQRQKVRQCFKIRIVGLFVGLCAYAKTRRACRNAFFQ